MQIKFNKAMKIISLLTIIILTLIMSFVSAQAASQISILNDITLGGENTARDQTITFDFYVQNTGTNILSNFNVVAKDNSNNLLNENFVAVSFPEGKPSQLDVNQQAKVRLTYKIPTNKDSVKETIGKIIATGSFGSETISAEKEITMEAKSYLRFQDVTVYIDNDEERDSTIEVRHNDKVKIVVILENEYSEDDNIKIENSYFTIDTDEDWDFVDEEESNEEDIDEDDVSNELEIEFTVDKDDIDDEEITFTLIAKGDDEEFGFEHYAEKTIKFSLISPKDEIVIRDVVLSENPIDCNKEFLDATIKLENTGDNDQERAFIHVKSNSFNLDWETKLSYISIDEGDEYSTQIKIPLKNVAKTYFFSVEVYNDDWDVSDYKGVVFKIVCDNPHAIVPTTNTTTPIITPPTTNTTTNTNTTVVVKPTENKPIVVVNSNLKYESPRIATGFKSLWQKFLDFFR